MKTRGPNQNTSFQQFVLDQLQDLSGVTCRAMFGGFGLYEKEVFFGIIHKGLLYFKTDEATREPYLKQEMKPFRPNRSQTLKNYYEVPADVIDDPEQLMSWAEQAVACQSGKTKVGLPRGEKI